MTPNFHHVDEHDPAQPEAAPVIAVPGGSGCGGACQRGLVVGLRVGPVVRRSAVPDPDDPRLHTSGALATRERTNFRAYQVAEELDGLVALRGKPTSIRVDNGRSLPVGCSISGPT